MTEIRAGRLPTAAGYDADIIILSLDRPDETEAAIVSALSQAGLTRHVIVLDQGSTAENLTRFARLIDGRADALLAAAGGNFGVAGGRNRASELGQGRVIIALDNDAVFATPDTAARAVAVLDAAPDCAVLAFRILNGDGSADDHACWGYPEALRPQAAERFACATFVGAGHAISRRAWVAVGGYDSALEFTWEEFDFALRAIARGWRLVYDGTLAVHHKRASAARFNWAEKRWFLYVRNRLYIARKWRRPAFFLAARATAYALKSFKIGLSKEGLRGIRAGFAMPLPHPPTEIDAAATAYLWQTDGRWRGGFWQRLRREVFAALPSSRQTEGGNSSVTNRR